MRWLDYGILGIVALWAICAVVWLFVRRRNGRCGGCCACGRRERKACKACKNPPADSPRED